MGKPSSPKSPDPYATASAQSDANLKAIQESAKLSSIDTYSPTGSTTYQRDANGDPISQTVSLNPGEQQYYTGQTGLKNALLGNIPTGAFQNPGGNGDAVEKALYDRQVALLQPQLDQAQKQSDVQLSDRGIPIGSEVYKDEENRLAGNRNSALTTAAQNATLAGGQEQTRQLQDALATYNEPFNALSAIQGGSSVAQPQLQSTPAYQVAAPNISGLIGQDYQNNLNSYNQNQSSLYNGLFGLGSAALGLLSDRRVKRDIKRVGTLNNGIPVFGFRYKAGGPYMFGVMAQDVETIVPAAVFDVGKGLKAVNYRALAEAV